MTKYVLVLKNYPFSSNLGSSLVNIYDFFVLVILKNKLMKIKSNYKHRIMHVDRETTKNQSTD